MLNKGKAKFFVYQDKNHYDKIFEEIRGIPANWNPQRINKKIQKKFSFSLMVNQPIKQDMTENLTLFRVRVINENESIIENDIASFSYPPKKKCKIGRANRKGQQVFYASGDPHTPYFELAKQIKIKSSIVYLSKWGVKSFPDEINMRTFFYGVPTKEEENDHATIMARGLKEKIDNIFRKTPSVPKENLIYAQKLYTELFTSQNEEFYHITSSIAYHTFIHTQKQNVEIPIITYPSIAKDKRAVNFAFRKDFADKHLYLKEVDKVIVKELGEKIIYTPISRGVVENNKVVWRNLNIQVKEIHYDKAILSYDKEQPINLKPLGINDSLTSCCIEHKYNIKMYLERKRFNDDLLLNGLEQMPSINFADFILDENLTYVVMIPTDEALYLCDNISDSGKINFVGLPVTYSISYN